MPQPNPQLESLKADLLAALIEHTAIQQDGTKERLSKLNTVAEFINDCKDNADYWLRQGAEWDHDFYFEFGRIYKRFAEKGEQIHA